jgi:hypothetical protein
LRLLQTNYRRRGVVVLATIFSNASRYSQGGGTGRRRIIRLPGGGVNQALPVILEAQECKKMQKRTKRRKEVGLTAPKNRVFDVKFFRL